VINQLDNGKQLAFLGPFGIENPPRLGVSGQKHLAKCNALPSWNRDG